MIKDSPLKCFTFKSSLLATLTALLLLSGCSSTFRSYSDTLSYAFFPGPGVELSPEQVRNLPQAGLFVTVGDRPRALLVQFSQQSAAEKWVSFDRALIELKQGRLVHTAGFSQDLQFRKVIGKDYLALGLDKIKTGMRFEVMEDYLGAGVQSMPAVYQVLDVAAATLEVWQQAIPVRVLYEQVEFYDGSTFINEFWFSQQDGQLLKSKQKLAPFWQVFETMYISQIAQLQGVQQ
jgi:hypothetical protein